MPFIDFFLLKSRGNQAQLAVEETEKITDLETDLAATKDALKMEEQEADKWAEQAANAYLAINYLLEKLGDPDIEDADEAVKSAIALASKRMARKPAQLS